MLHGIWKLNSAIVSTRNASDSVICFELKRIITNCLIVSKIYRITILVRIQSRANMDLKHLQVSSGSNRSGHTLENKKMHQSKRGFPNNAPVLPLFCFLLQIRIRCKILRDFFLSINNVIPHFGSKLSYKRKFRPKWRCSIYPK